MSQSKSKSSPNPPASIQGYDPEPPRVQPGSQSQAQSQSQPQPQPRTTVLPSGHFTHILPFYPGYHSQLVPLPNTSPPSWTYLQGTYSAPTTASSTGWIVPPSQPQFAAVPLPYHPYSYNYNHHYYHPAAPLHLLPTTSTPTYNLASGSMATRTRMFHPTSSTRQTATDTPTPPPVYTELTSLGPGYGHGHGHGNEGYTRMSGRVEGNILGTRMGDRSRSRSRERERERGRERSRSPVRDRQNQAQQLQGRQQHRQHLQKHIAPSHTKSQTQSTSQSTALPLSPHIPSSVLEIETETESVSISLSSSQSQPRIPRKIDLVPQSWLMGRSVSASGSDLLLGAGSTGKESGNPTSRSTFAEGSEVVGRDGEARRSLKRDWSPRPRSVGSRHQPIPSPYTARFPGIPLQPGPSGWQNMDMDVDVGSEEVESTSESEQTDDSQGTSGNEEEAVQGSKGIPLAVYRHSHSRSQARDHHQQHHHTQDFHRPTSTGGSKGPEPVRYEFSDGVGGSISWTQAGSEPESEMETVFSPTSLVNLPVSYRDIPNPRWVIPRSTKASASNQAGMNILTDLSHIDPGVRRPTACQVKRKRPSTSGRSAELAALDPDEGVVHTAPLQGKGDDRVASFEACFGDMSDLTDLEEDNAINGEAVTTFYMASRAGDEKDSARRPTRHAARKATARIQAIASPERTSDSASDMAKNTWNQTLHVDVEDERSDESQRSMGTRKIKRRARRTVTLPDPAPDQTVHKVARGRTAAHHPSLVQSSIVHVCPIPGCGACFKRREHVKRHVRGIHTLEKPYHCLHNGCGKSFARRDNLGLHYTKVHKMSNRKCLQLLASGDKEV